MIFGLFLLLAPSPVLTANPLTPVAAAQSAAGPSDWQADLKRRRDMLVERNGPGTNAALRAELLSMRDHDQDARGMHRAPGEGSKQPQIALNLAEIDKSLTDELKGIFEKNGWPTINLVGIEASNAAMLILTHTADHAWQRTLLPQLEALADSKRIDGSALALVIDKDLIAHGQPQRYGSQFKLVNGEMAMYAVEDPGALDRMRAEALLPPMDVYRKNLIDIYHFNISKQIIAPSAPAPQP